jgi:hypothetical protein
MDGDQMEPPRDRHQRQADALATLPHDHDVWVATSDADGPPYLVPPSLDWDGSLTWSTLIALFASMSTCLTRTGMQPGHRLEQLASIESASGACRGF